MRNRIPAEIIDRASEWFVEMREPTVELAQRESFSAWLRQSPVHVQAYLEIASLWGDAAQLDPARDFGIEDALREGEGTPNVVPFMLADAAREGRSPTRSASENAAAPANAGDARLPLDSTRSTSPDAAAAVASQGKHATLHRLADWRIAASILFVFAAMLGTWWQFARAPVYSADVGEQRMITLDDGSVVRLNSRSQVRVELTASHRSVELLSGQAHFEVAKDSRRPFVVRSGAASIVAVGTAFDVYRKKDLGTVVTVVEGRVLVNRGAPPAVDISPTPPQGLPVSAGEQVVVTRAGAIERRKGNIAAATSWLRHEMIFNGEPLSLVVEEFNRYTRRTIVIDDPSLAELRINAVFHSTNPDSLLKFVSRFDGVEVREGPSQIRISRREPT